MTEPWSDDPYRQFQLKNTVLQNFDKHLSNSETIQKPLQLIIIIVFWERTTESPEDMYLTTEI